MKHVDIFCDGACSGNPGPGGFGALLRYNGVSKELLGFHPQTTNNQMELFAAIAALTTLKEPCSVTLTTDSEYVKKGITEWIHTWKVNGWKSGRKPVKNKELWLQLEQAASQHQIAWQWVRGHSGHPENERCDELARLAISRRQPLINLPTDSVTASPQRPVESRLASQTLSHHSR